MTAALKADPLRTAATRLALRKRFIPLMRRQAGFFTDRETETIRRFMETWRRERNLRAFIESVDAYYAEPHTNLLARTMGPVFHAYSTKISEAAAAEIIAEPNPAITADFTNRYTLSFADRQAARSKSRITAVIEKDLSDDERLDELDARFARWQKNTPQTVANANGTQLLGAVSKVTFASAGIAFLVWIAIGKSCPLCSRLDGRTVGIADDFVAAGQTLAGDDVVAPITPSVNIGHPPLHGGCDCFVAAGV